MSDVKRICGVCGMNRTLVNQGIYEVRDFRGNGFALVGTCCWSKVNALLDLLFIKYGGWIKDGVSVASCNGSPTIRSVAHLQQEVGATL